MLGAAVLTLLPGLGCTGHASISKIQMGGRKISATAPLVQEIKPNECYYWVNDRNELCIAMRRHKRSLLGKRHSSEHLLSLVLEGLPADTSRDYPVSRRTLRMRYSAGYTHLRAASLSGIATVWDYGSRVIRGRFRITAKQQAYSVLTDWGSNKAVLLVGEFSAVPDREAGERILTRTERRGMGRPAPGSEPTLVPGGHRASEPAIAPAPRTAAPRPEPADTSASN